MLWRMVMVSSPTRNFFNQQSHDFLAFKDTKSFGSTAQTGKECCESFC